MKYRSTKYIVGKIIHVVLVSLFLTLNIINSEGSFWIAGFGI